MSVVKLVSCLGLLVCALVMTACGHQGITDAQVRNQVRKFMHPPGAAWTIVSVSSCSRSGGTNEWRCHVRARMPRSTDAFIPNVVKTVDLEVTASCAGKRCELARNDWTAFAPMNAAAKAVINDWYDGGIDHPHSCAAVKAAISLLPVDGGTYSTARRDLEAYEHKVC
jgi:hypothetical protein